MPGKNFRNQDRSTKGFLSMKEKYRFSVKNSKDSMESLRKRTVRLEASEDKLKKCRKT